MIITLDGPAGAGKSSAARALAARLGWCYMDTGAMYRAVTLVALERGVPLEDATRMAALADAPPVREAMKRIQRRMAEGLDIVTEGRDQGSVVFPHAEVKVFVTATPEERARRRHREEQARGSGLSLADVLASQAARDDGDRSRAVGAMRAADDAVILETDGLAPEEVVDRLVALIETRRGPRGPA